MVGVRNLTDAACSQALSSTALATPAPVPTTLGFANQSTSTAPAAVATNVPTSPTAQIIVESSSASAGMSIGAKAGIGIAFGVLVVVVVGMAGWCVVGKRRRERDMDYLRWIEKRGVVGDRCELEGLERVEMDAVVVPKLKVRVRDGVG